MITVKVEGQDWPCCDVCGIPAYSQEVTIKFEKDWEPEVLCKSCERLIDAGMLRREGPGVYRRWTFEWQPGELVKPPDKATIESWTHQYRSRT